jgi:hypothetical protein
MQRILAARKPQGRSRVAQERELAFVGNSPSDRDVVDGNATATNARMNKKLINES